MNRKKSEKNSKDDKFPFILIGIAILLVAGLIFYYASHHPSEAAAPASNTPSAQSAEGSSNASKYVTVSDGGNVKITVTLMNPVEKNENDLVFNVMFETHAVDLTAYKNLGKFVQLQSDDISVADGFTFKVDNDDSHHLSGTLKVKNSFNGKPLLTDSTKSLKLTFNNVADVPKRDHVYAGDALK